MALDPSSASAAGRQALAEVLLHIRSQLLEREAGQRRSHGDFAPVPQSWEEFSAIALRDAGLELKPSSIKRYATPAYGNVPNPGLFYALAAWGVFTFPNGEPVTAEALYEVLLELRTPSGDLIRRIRNGRH